MAVLIRCLTVLTGAVIRRDRPFRPAFNAAQNSLGLGAAALVLAGFGIHPQPSQPWLLSSGQLLPAGLAAVSYFAVSFGLVTMAVSLHRRAPVATTFRQEIPHQAFVSAVLLSAAPLVVVVMGRSAVLALLLLLPLIAVHANAVVSLQREHQANHDELTGLPNRTFLLRRIAEALADTARTGCGTGFLLLDLDGFKEVNDTLGHPAGDRMLAMVGTRLAHSVRPGDVVARLGGDEFAVLLPAVGGAGIAWEVATRLRACLAQPLHLEGMSFEVAASVGIALCPGDAAGAEELLQHADVAMYMAKERGTGVETYACDADRRSAARLSLLADLRHGLDEGQLELHFQPKVSLADGRTEGMEALLRWHHPERGLVLPAEFLGIAEQSYLMRDLTAWVMDTAFARFGSWQRQGLSVPVCINLTARDLLDTALGDTLDAALDRHGLAPTDLVLEISERVLAGGPAHAAATVDALAARGIPISLDDFGTGHSSLVRLRRLPVSEVKIDSSLISGVLDHQENKRVVTSLVELVRALGIRSVAEGVETAEVAGALAAMGCESAQGWHFSAPLDSASAGQWLAHRRPVSPGGPLLPPGMPPKARQPRKRTERALSERASERVLPERALTERVLPERASERALAERAVPQLAIAGPDVPAPVPVPDSGRSASVAGWLHADCP